MDKVERKTYKRKKNSVRFSLDIHPDLDKLIESLSKDENCTKTELLRRAVSTLEAFREVKNKKYDIAAIDAEENIVYRIIFI